MSENGKSQRDEDFQTAEFLAPISTLFDEADEELGGDVSVLTDWAMMAVPTVLLIELLPSELEATIERHQAEIDAMSVYGKPQQLDAESFECRRS